MNTISRRLQTLAAAILCAQLFGCASASKPSKIAEAPADTKAAVATETPAAAVGKSGAELWAENCNRCHNVRSPQSYSPMQWEVAMLHMRVRANLTPAEHTRILEFLKSVN